MAKGIWADTSKIKKIWVDTSKIKKVWVDTSLVWTSAIANDQGMNMNSCKIRVGSGASNPISGGTSNNWSIAFYFVWHSAKGGALLYHNYNQRESIIKLENDGRIMVNANRYDTNNYKTWYSTQKCEVGKLNGVVVSKSGQIFINGVNATPSTYGGDMNFWGYVDLFPDRDINGTILGLQAWDWTMNSSYTYVSNPVTWPFETDKSSYAINFDGSTGARIQSVGNGTQALTGTPTYATYEWNEDREATKI